MLGGLAVAVLAFASQAIANTTVQVSMTFTEPIVPAFKSGDCPVVPEGFCGSGQVIPLGHATETIEFSAACGGACDLRTINLAGGSIISEETFSNPNCPGACQPNFVVGGTGIFTGATGTLTGTVRAAGLQSQIKLSGTIHYDP
jgi:hypothetical protein